MLTASDMIWLPYAPDLTQAGIVYACRSLAHTYNRMGGSQFTRLRRIVAGKAVELAFRRYLSAQQVPFDTLGATPFTDPDRYDVAIGGRRCDIKSFLFSQKEPIRRLRRQPASLLQASALVPADQAAATHLTDEDLYIFAFATALVTPTRQDLERALAAGQPSYLIHPFPRLWASPGKWASLGEVSLASEAGQPLEIELGGQQADRSFATEQVSLPSHGRVGLKTDFYTLAFAHPRQVPGGELHIHSPRLKQTLTLAPLDWGNIWVYGMEVILAGYIRRGEFRRRAAYLPPGSRVFQYERTRTANISLPVAELDPIGELLERVRSWVGRS